MGADPSTGTDQYWRLRSQPKPIAAIFRGVISVRENGIEGNLHTIFQNNPLSGQNNGTWRKIHIPSYANIFKASEHNISCNLEIFSTPHHSKTKKKTAKAHQNRYIR